MSERIWRNADNAFQHVKLYMSKATYEMLRIRSNAKGIPISKLVQVAIDNELDAPAPFSFLCEMPTQTFIENAYIDEAQKLAKYLIKFPSGTGRDQLMLMRRDIGIPNKETFMLAYRELLEANVIEEVGVPKSSKFKYPMGYKYARLKHVDRSALVSRKRRIFEKMRKELELEEKLDREANEAKLKTYGLEQPE